MSVEQEQAKERFIDRLARICPKMAWRPAPGQPSVVCGIVADDFGMDAVECRNMTDHEVRLLIEQRARSLASYAAFVGPRTDHSDEPAFITTSTGKPCD